MGINCEANPLNCDDLTSHIERVQTVLMHMDMDIDIAM